MDDIYQEQILDHCRNPRNFGELRNSIKAREANASCGDMIEISIKLNPTKLRRGVSKEIRIEKIKFKGLGCALAIAAASMLTEKVKGKALTEISKISSDDMVGMLGIEVSPTRVKCVQLPLVALRRAIYERGK